jgi:hypothetical protein
MDVSLASVPESCTADSGEPLRPASPIHPSYRLLYDIGPLDGKWWAVCLRGGPVLEAATEAELADLIRTDYARRGVS